LRVAASVTYQPLVFSDQGGIELNGSLALRDDFSSSNVPPVFSTLAPGALFACTNVSAPSVSGTISGASLHSPTTYQTSTFSGMGKFGWTVIAVLCAA
jgi:hypothetical protein